MTCDVCPAIADCKHAFGKFWPDKSSNGTGCKHPFRGWNVRRPALPPSRPKSVSQGDIFNNPPARPPVRRR